MIATILAVLSYLCRIYCIGFGAWMAIEGAVAFATLAGHDLDEIYGHVPNAIGLSKIDMLARATAWGTTGVLIFVLSSIWWLADAVRVLP